MKFLRKFSFFSDIIMDTVSTNEVLSYTKKKNLTLTLLLQPLDVGINRPNVKISCGTK